LNSNSDYLSIDSEWIPTFIKWIPVILSLIGAGIGLVIYPLSGDRVSKGIYTLFSNKWHIDQIYNNYIVKNVLSFSHNISYKIIDRGLIEFIGPTGISNLIKSLSVNSSSIQTGSIYNYGLIIIIGTLAVLLVKKFKFDSFFLSLCSKKWQKVRKKARKVCLRGRKPFIPPE
jgi:NADH-ubiquinone oxidoreductase chain 5